MELKGSSQILDITLGNCKKSPLKYFTETIIYKKTDHWHIEWHRVTTRDNGWQRMTTSCTTRDNEWQWMARENEWQQVTTKDSDWKRVTTNDSECQRVIILANFLFSRTREEPTTMHAKESL